MGPDEAKIIKELDEDLDEALAAMLQDIDEILEKAAKEATPVKKVPTPPPRSSAPPPIPPRPSAPTKTAPPIPPPRAKTGQPGDLKIVKEALEQIEKNAKHAPPSPEINALLPVLDKLNNALKKVPTKRTPGPKYSRLIKTLNKVRFGISNLLLKQNKLAGLKKLSSIMRTHHKDQAKKEIPQKAIEELLSKEYSQIKRSKIFREDWQKHFKELSLKDSIPYLLKQSNKSLSDLNIDLQQGGSFANNDPKKKTIRDLMLIKSNFSKLSAGAEGEQVKFAIALRDLSSSTEIGQKGIKEILRESQDISDLEALRESFEEGGKLAEFKSEFGPLCEDILEEKRRLQPQA